MNTELKAIDSKIAGIRRRGTTLRSDAAECAVMIMDHANTHGDCSRALRLVEALPFASERVKLINWFKAFSPINVTWNAEASKRKVGYNKPDAKSYNAFNLDGAKANPYYEYGAVSDDDETAKLLGTADVNSDILRLADREQRRVDNGLIAANDKEAVIAKIAALRNVATVTAAAA